MWQESLRKKKYSTEMSTKARLMFLRSCTLWVFVKEESYSNLLGQAFMEHLKTCIIWMLMGPTCQQQESKQDGQESQENNQDRKNMPSSASE